MMKGSTSRAKPHTSANVLATNNKPSSQAYVRDIPGDKIHRRTGENVPLCVCIVRQAKGKKTRYLSSTRREAKK